MAKASQQRVPKSQRADPLVLANARWQAARSKVDAKTAEWQKLEHRLFAKARSRAMDFAAAGKSDLPEAKAMRALDRKIRRGYLRLAESAKRVRATRATSILGALAKIELGLKVQGLFDWKANAQELLEEGVMEARELIATINDAAR
jgi:anti-sigma factor RsiW